MRHVILPLALALTLSGCGWKKEAARLQAALVEADASIADKETTVATQQKEIDDLGARIASLESDIADKQAEIQALEAALDDEREQRARILADRGALRNEVASMKEALTDLQERKRQAEARVAAYRDLVARFQALIDAGTLDVRIIDGRMVVVLNNDILFASGAADLSDDGRAALSEVAAVFTQFPDRRFQVEGHTDDQPIRTSRFPSNWYLASARAIHVVEHLVASGVGADAVSAASYADTRPVAANDSEEGRSQNRRIEIVVVPDLSELPGYDELADL